MRRRILIFAVLLVLLENVLAQDIANANSPTLTVASNLPDLAIVSIKTIPEPLIAEQNYNVLVKLMNNGRVQNNEDFYIEFSGSTNKPRLYLVEYKIRPGEIYDYLIENIPSFTETGSHQIKIRVDLSSEDPDANNIVSESNERNNIRTYDVSVERGSGFRPDYNPDEIRSGPGEPISGDDFIDEPGRRYALVDNPNLDKEDSDDGFDMIMIIMVIVLAISVVSIFWYLVKMRTGVAVSMKEKRLSRDEEVKKLNSEMGEIKHMIKLANVKYHKRELDEESFREIVRDHEKRLIELETKIEELRTKKK